MPEFCIEKKVKKMFMSALRCSVQWKSGGRIPQSCEKRIFYLDIFILSLAPGVVSRKCSVVGCSYWDGVLAVLIHIFPELLWRSLERGEERNMQPVILDICIVSYYPLKWYSIMINFV